jgi:hypothetical protein
LTQWGPSCLLKWDGHRQDFSTRNNRNFFRPGPNPARPEKCSPLVHGCTQWIGTSCARATRAARGIEDSRGSPGPAEPETSVCVTRECMGDDCSSGQAGALSLSLSLRTCDLCESQPKRIRPESPFLARGSIFPPGQVHSIHTHVARSSLFVLV